MEELNAGLYEVLVTEGLKARLDALADALPSEQRALHPAEAPDRIAWHLSREIERALSDVGEADRARVGIEVARALLDRLGDLVEVDSSAAPIDPATVLHAILGRLPDGSSEPVAEPLIPLLDTTLLTNAPGEPNLWNQLRSEIESADRIDVVMAFIRRSGIAPLLDALRHNCDRDRQLRVLTTTYTGSTEQAALDQLADLGADVRVSYDLSTTRLHAKAWVFHRSSGFSTAYVGSSNLTHSAQVTGMEWNVRASEARNPDVIAKFGAVFESYWSGGDYLPYNPEQFEEEQQRAGRTGIGADSVEGPQSLSPRETLPDNIAIPDSNQADQPTLEVDITEFVSRWNEAAGPYADISGLALEYTDTAIVGTSRLFREVAEERAPVNVQLEVLIDYESYAVRSAMVDWPEDHMEVSSVWIDAILSGMVHASTTSDARAGQTLSDIERRLAGDVIRDDGYIISSGNLEVGLTYGSAEWSVEIAPR